MFSNVLFLIYATAATGHFLPSEFLSLNNTSIDDERIIGGKEVVKNSFPFTVRVQSKRGENHESLGGAVLIHENYVLTAAHCVYDPQSPFIGVTLHFGDHNYKQEEKTRITMKIPMENIYRHPDYDKKNVNNDIALIKLPSPVPISQYVQPICIASKETESKYKSGTAVGWGVTEYGGSSAVLKQVDLPILTPDDCKNFPFFNPRIMICAGNTVGIKEAICTGDSGGPFFVNSSKPILVGLTSFASPLGCAAVGWGVGFVKVTAYVDWMRNIMGSDLCIL